MTKTKAQERDEIAVADTIYGEARGEPHPDGLVAVANVIANRKALSPKYGDGWAGVCLRPRQFSCWNHKDPNVAVITSPQRFSDPVYKLCLSIARQAISGELEDITAGSTHYHDVRISPRWADSNAKKTQIGDHVFYRLNE